MDIKIFDVESLYRCESCGAKWGEQHKSLGYFYDLYKEVAAEMLKAMGET